jgi:hypothetical protein
VLSEHIFHSISVFSEMGMATSFALFVDVLKWREAAKLLKTKTTTPKELKDLYDKLTANPEYDIFGPVSRWLVRYIKNKTLPWIIYALPYGGFILGCFVMMRMAFECSDVFAYWLLGFSVVSFLLSLVSAVADASLARTAKRLEQARNKEARAAYEKMRMDNLTQAIRSEIHTALSSSNDASNRSSGGKSA